MAAERIIPPALVGEITSQSLAGKTTREIARWLLEQHQVEVSYRTVARLLEGARRDRAEGIKASVREALGPQVLGDLERLELHAQKLHELAIRQFERGKEREYLFTVEQLRKLCHTRLHFSGADTPDDSLTALADAAKAVSGRLDRLASTIGAGGEDGPGRGNGG